MRTLPTSMTLVMLPPHVLGPKYERRKRPRNSQGFRIGKRRGNLARTPDVAGVKIGFVSVRTIKGRSISLNRFLAPVDDNVTAQSTLQSTFKCLRRLGVPPRPPLQDWNGSQAWDSDRRVTVNNIQVMLVCGRPGDRGGGTETPDASVPRHKMHARYSEIRNP